MEVIHSGNCDCPFPGRGCAWDVPAASSGRPRPPLRSGRTVPPHGPADLVGPRASSAAAEAGAARWLGQPSTCRGRRAPRRSQLPAPRALCYSPTSCLPPPDPGSLPGRGSRGRPRVSWRLARPLGSASCASESRPQPGNVPGPPPSTRGRCAAVWTAHGWDRRSLHTPGSALPHPGSPWEQQLDMSSVFVLVA